MRDPVAWVDDLSGRMYVIWGRNGEMKSAVADKFGRWTEGVFVDPWDFKDNFANVSGAEAEKVIRSLSKVRAARKRAAFRIITGGQNEVRS